LPLNFAPIAVFFVILADCGAGAAVFCIATNSSAL